MCTTFFFVLCFTTKSVPFDSMCEIRFFLHYIRMCVRFAFFIGFRLRVKLFFSPSLAPRSTPTFSSNLLFCSLCVDR